MAHWLRLAVVLGLLAVAGCGSDAKPKAEKGEAQNAAARSSEDPGASSELIEALRNAKRGSPEHTILSLFYYARWGNYPSLVRLYDPKVRSTIDRTKIASVYSDNRGRFLVIGVPKIVDTQRVPEGFTVGVELHPPGEKTVQESYLLRKGTEEWVIAYDTFFDRAYGEAARVGVDGPGAKASTRGAKAARRASAEFRNLFLPK